MKTNFNLLAILVCLASMVEAHTWLEQIFLIGSDGSFTGAPGYPRGYAKRGAGVSDDDFVWKLTGMIPSDAKMCRPSQQTPSSYKSDFSPVAAAPSDFIAMQHLENGHVTQPLLTTRAAGSGTVFVYGTTDPSDSDTYFGIHRVWNAAGTGGDKRGKLLATSHFDDGRCFQVIGNPISQERIRRYNWQSSDDNPCQTDVQIPADAPTSGKYTMYWVWEWPQLDATGKQTSNESYTACLDVNMIAKSTVGKITFDPAKLARGGKNIVDRMAIPEQLANQFQVDPSAKPALTFGPPFTMSPLAAATPHATSALPGPATPIASSTPVASPKPVTTSATTTTAKPSTPVQPSGFVTVTVTESFKEMTTVYVTQDPQATPQPQIQSASKLTLSISPPAATTSQASSAYVMPTGAPQVKPFMPAARSFRVRGREVQL